ncbi:MAG: hypothetical protein WBM99_07305 [Psychromonas sp.]
MRSSNRSQKSNEFDDEWQDQDDLIHARKNHQNHRGRDKGQVHHDGEYVKGSRKSHESFDEDFDYE